ncbi:MAG: DUF5020 family protein [Bacteroidales bacterium]|nr:DUF5020 family protein [Bacteroidales bacterium]
MRKLFLFTLSLVAFASLNAQNLQLHFDPRHAFYGDDVAAKNYLTATFEMFKPDAWGSTFMFVDFDFNGDKRNIGLAYAEIARAFKIKDFALMPHLEYNGGLGTGFSIPSSYLAGAQYPFRLGNFFMGTYLAYKLNAFTELSHDVQWTLTWNSAFPNSKVSLAGFLDLWTENKNRATGEGGKKLILLSEPQVWYNFTPNFAIGSEIELSYNFVNAFAESKFYAVPTLATKWNF